MPVVLSMPSNFTYQYAVSNIDPYLRDMQTGAQNGEVPKIMVLNWQSRNLSAGLSDFRASISNQYTELLLSLY